MRTILAPMILAICLVPSPTAETADWAAEARVAANSLGMAQRELQYGAELQAAELTRLQALLGLQDNLDAMRRELVSQLRDGLDLETPGLARHLRQTVAGQLFIDQPRYSGLQGLP